MIENNKILSLTVIGVILGGILGALVEFEQMGMYSVAAVGGVIGFIAGWVWQSRSDKSEEDSSDDSTSEE
jgi:predicted MFS family arabinose efflux permease